MDERIEGWMFCGQKTLSDGWMDGWEAGCKSRVKDCLQQSKMKYIVILDRKSQGDTYVKSR